jgi:purine nucleoside phosphorylase
VIPEQLIDYTYGREHTFYDGAERSGMVEQFQHVEHIDFSAPYARDLREKIIRFLYKADIDCVGHGVYGCTQGPRLETAAEIERLKRDGCDVVGMTAMPEAALAKEVGIDYAAVAVVVNWAAGVATQPLSMLDIMNTVRENMGKVKGILPELLPFL